MTDLSLASVSSLTIKACDAPYASPAAYQYLEEIAADHSEAAHFQGALIDVVDADRDHPVELYSIPDMEGDYVSRTNGTRLLWMPELKRAALNAYQGGDWCWTDASDPEDALRRYRDDEMMA